MKMMRPQFRVFMPGKYCRLGNATHDINFKKTKPVFVGNLLKRLGLENAQVVDENIDIGEPFDGDTDSVGVAKIGGQTFHLGLRMRGSN